MKKAPKQAPPKKSPVVPALIFGVLVIVAAVAYKLGRSNPQAPPASPPTVEAAHSAPAPRPTISAERAMPTEAATPAAEPVPGPAPAPPVARAPKQSEAPRADPKDLVAALSLLDGKEPISAEQAQKWKDALQQLVHQGPSSIPAIQQYLAQNVDVNFAGVSGAGALGYSSLRSGMLDALAQIGGPDSTAAMLQVLQTSIFPPDIATLAKDLEAQSATPGQYQQAILDAVKQQLNLGAMDQLGGANVLPLFQVLAGQAANGVNLTADLAQYSEKWPYYSSITLAAMPDGAGVATLMQMAQSESPGNQTAAAQALAELAPQNPQVLNSLLELAKNGQLSDNILAQLAPYFGGRLNQLGPPDNPAAGGYLTFHMANGNQDFSAYDASGTLSQSQITQRISIIDQFLQAIPQTDTAAVDSLNQQRAALVGRQKP